jgi:hypothetical protein
MTVQVIRSRDRVTVYSNGKQIKTVYSKNRNVIEVYAEVVQLLQAVGIIVNKHLGVV